MKNLKVNTFHLTDQLRKSLNESVLCWLATVSASGQPSVSPKEIFALHGNDEIIIANIASPQSMKNILSNPKVCVTVLEIWTQKGHQFYGDARILRRGEEYFEERAQHLQKMTGGRFPFEVIFSISLKTVKPILAPSYIFYPETSEEDQIANAMRTYGVKRITD